MLTRSKNTNWIGVWHIEFIYLFNYCLWFSHFSLHLFLLIFSLIPVYLFCSWNFHIIFSYQISVGVPFFFIFFCFCLYLYCKWINIYINRSPFTHVLWNTVFFYYHLNIETSSSFIFTFCFFFGLLRVFYNFFIICYH